MLQLLRLVVHFVPLQPEDLGQHALDQVMAVQQTVGDVAARGGQRDLAFLAHLDQRVAPQPLDRHGDRRGGYAEPADQRHGLDGFALALGLGDGLQVILFGNGDAQGQAIGLEFLEGLTVEPVGAFVDLGCLPGGVLALQADAVGAGLQRGQFGARGQRAPAWGGSFGLGSADCPNARSASNLPVARA